MGPSTTGRLMKEYKMLKQQQERGILKGVDIAQDPNNSLVWHFVLFDFDATSAYHGGVYHGILTYPFLPPNIKVLTPSGRFVTNTSICFTMSDFHPETWNPAWNMVTVLLGIRSFMEDPAEPGTTGGCVSTTGRKQQLAKESVAYNSKDVLFTKLFPSLLEE